MKTWEQDQLNLKNTPSVPLAKRYCWNERPCYRLLECAYCWNRKKSHLVDQFHFYGHHWGFQQFITIGLRNSKLSPDEALLTLAKIRSPLHKFLFKRSKYVSLIAVHNSNLGKNTPHFHIATTGIVSQKKLRNAFGLILRKIDVRGTFSVNISEIPDLYGLAFYFIDHNFRLTLPHRPRGLRLISASRPFLTGKPKKLKHIQEWKQNEKKRLYNK